MTPRVQLACPHCAAVRAPPESGASSPATPKKCFEKDPKRPWRIQQIPNGKVAIVGYNDQTEVTNAETIGAQRAVNVKYYMTTDELGPRVDPSRIEPRKGGTKGKAAHFYFVPQGATFTQEESVTVDESAVQASRARLPKAQSTRLRRPSSGLQVTAGSRECLPISRSTESCKKTRDELSLSVRAHAGSQDMTSPTIGNKHNPKVAEKATV